MRRYVLLLLVVFACSWGKAFADVGYVWIEDYGVNYNNKLLPDIGTVIDINTSKPRYVYNNTYTIDKITQALNEQPIQCHNKGAFNKRGEQMYIGVFEVEIFFNPQEKNCGFPAIKLRERFDYGELWTSGYLKRYKIISYYYSKSEVFALIEYSLLKDHPLNK